MKIQVESLKQLTVYLVMEEVLSSSRRVMMPLSGLM